MASYGCITAALYRTILQYSSWIYWRTKARKKMSKNTSSFQPKYKGRIVNTFSRLFQYCVKINKIKNMQTVNIFQYLGDLRSRVSTYIDPIKVEFEISNRKRFLIQPHTNFQKTFTSSCKSEEDNELVFVYNQFKISEVSKRLKTPKRFVDPMRSSNLPKGRLVKIRRRAQMAVEKLFAKPTR